MHRPRHNSKSHGRSPTKHKSMSLSRVFRVFRFEAHPRKRVLTIIGEVCLTSCDTTKKSIEFQRVEEFKKKIHLENLGEDTSTEHLVIRLMKYCPYIDDALIGQLTSTVEELKSRNYDSLGIASISQIAEDGSFLPRFPDMIENLDAMSLGRQLQDTEKIDINDLDQYVELLYEDLDSKIKGAHYISQLTKAESNLIIVASHETAINALMRTLREEAQKSLLLASIILNTCLHFARVPDFHDLLYTHSILSVVGTIITEELRRHDAATQQSCKDAKDEIKDSTHHMGEKPHKMSARAKKEAKLKMEICESIVQQDELLRISFSILYEMVNEITLLHQLSTPEVIKSLIDSLERENVGLLEIVLMTLKNLSIFKEAIETMASLNIIACLSNLLKSGTPMPKKLVSVCFHFLFNLSFESEMRDTMVDAGLLTSFANCLSESLTYAAKSLQKESDDLEDISVKILYNISMDPKNRYRFAPAVVNQVLERIFESKCKRITIELGALITNLTRNESCVQILRKNGNMSKLLEQSMRAEDELVMKSIRNAAETIGKLEISACEIRDLACAIVSSKSHEFVIDCIGAMCYLNPEKTDFYGLFKIHDLVPFFRVVITEGIHILDSGKPIKSPMLMEVINLVGTCIGNDRAAQYLIDEGIVELLLNLLCAIGEDNKMQEQIMFTFCKLVEHEMTRGFIIEKTEVPDALVSMFPHAKPEVQDSSYAVLLIISTFNEQWNQKVKDTFFAMANTKWMEMIEASEYRSPKNPCVFSPPEDIESLGEYDGLSDEISDDRSGESGSDNKNEISKIVQKQFSEEMAAKSGIYSLLGSDSSESDLELEITNGDEEFSDFTDTELHTDDSLKNG